MNTGHLTSRDTRYGGEAFTLVEVVLSLLMASVLLTGIISGYRLVLQRTEWANRSLAAQSLTMQQVEQIRAARWDPLAWPPEDQLISSNFPEVTLTLEIPTVGAVTNWATVTTTIQDLGTNPPLKAIRVDCVWSYANKGKFTNSLVTLRSPDQ